MSEQQVRVTFEPSGRAVFVLAGTKMLEAAARAGMTLDTPTTGVEAKVGQDLLRSAITGCGGT